MVDGTTLKHALKAWAGGLHAAADELNSLDGRLGDGDLGATLDKCATLIEAALPTMPDALGEVLRQCAQACAKASGSSFGTLLAVAFLGASKWVAESPEARSVLHPKDVAALLATTVTTLAQRGGAVLGDKTMLDSIDAIARALEAAQDGDDMVAVARGAAAHAVEEYRGRPNRIGRARMFAERSIGMEDPGMVAVLRMAESLAS